MNYLVIYTENNYEDGTVHVEYENYDSFEKMMIRFTLLCQAGDRVLVVEENTKKVVCSYEREGHTTFNRYLLDPMFLDNCDK